MSDNKDILQTLADAADEKARQQDEILEKRNNKTQKNKNKNKNKEKNKQERIMEPPPADESASGGTGEIGPQKDNLPLPELSLDDETGGDTFGELAEQMKEQGEALEEPSPPKKKKREPKSTLKAPHGGLGEEITKEQADKLISEKPKGGHRRTVITKTKVVREDGSTKAHKEPGQEETPEIKEPKAPVLVLIREDTGEVYEITSDLTIGREDDNDIVIPNPEGHYVSARHAEIQIQGKDIYLKDLGSTNGTYVNDRKIASRRIRAGNKVEFADIVFTVEEE